MRAALRSGGIDFAQLVDLPLHLLAVLDQRTPYTLFDRLHDAEHPMQGYRDGQLVRAEIRALRAP